MATPLTPRVSPCPSGADPRGTPGRRLPGCTHLVFISTALPPDRRPGLLCGHTSPGVPCPPPPPPQLSLPPTCRELVLPSLLEDGVAPYTSHSCLCPLPEGSAMWEYSSDDGQQHLMILILCARSKRGPPPALPWAPPAPRDQMSCREPQRVRSASLPRPRAEPPHRGLLPRWFLSHCLL